MSPARAGRDDVAEERARPADRGPTTESSGRPLSVREVVASTLGVTGFAVAQPLLSVLGENPILFSQNYVQGAGLVLIAAVVTVAPAVVAMAVPLGLRVVDHRWARRALVAILGTFAWLAAVQWIASAVGGVVVPLTGATLAAGSFAVAYHRSAALRTWTQLASPLPMVAAVLFLTTSPASDLIRIQAAGEADPSLGGQHDVVVVLLDEFPTLSLLDENGDVDAARFPNLAEFSEGATWYRNHTSVAAATKYAVPAILTGANPREREPLWASYPDNLFSLLAPTHHLTVFERPTKLCGLAACSERGPLTRSDGPGPRYGSVLRTAWDIWLDRVRLDVDQAIEFDEFAEDVASAQTNGAGAAEPGTDAQINPFDAVAVTANKPERLTRFNEALAADAPPGLYFLHLVLPHIPWQFYADGTLYAPDYEATPIYPYNDKGPWVSAVGEQQHLLQAQHTDSLVGTTLERLRRTGQYDEALIIVMADHGLSLVPDTDHRTMNEVTLSSVAFAPLFVKYPGQTAGVIDDRNAMSIDVLPTIAEVEGVEVDWPLDGQSLRSTQPRRGTSWAFPITQEQLPVRLGERIDFRVEDHAPKASDRWLEPARDGEDLMAPLLDFAGVGEAAGMQFEPSPAAHSGTAVVASLDRLRRPPQNSPVPGFVHGTVDGIDEGWPIVVAVNGTIVSGSRQFSLDGQRRFAAFLPPSSLQSQNELRLGAIGPDGIIELAVEAQ